MRAAIAGKTRRARSAARAKFKLRHYRRVTMVTTLAPGKLNTGWENRFAAPVKGAFDERAARRCNLWQLAGARGPSASVQLPRSGSASISVSMDQASTGDVMRRIVFAILTTLGLTWSAQALAWGDSGHRTVCEIAWRNLTPTAQAEVQRLLQAHPVIPVAAPRFKELGWACTYPDNTVAGGPGRRDAEHFVNYARTTLAVTQVSGCGVATSCIITAIAADLARLGSISSSDKDKAEALIYLGHWFGDIHQPLHSSFKDDKGGNDINSQGLCTRALHSTWDTCILRQNAYADEGEPSIDTVRALADSWSAEVRDIDRAVWLSSEPWQWSAESYEVTIRPVVGYCVMVAGTCQYSTTQIAFAGTPPPRRSVMIDAAYMAGAMPIIQRRITQAGIRLAHQLNLALDPAYRN